MAVREAATRRGHRRSCAFNAHIPRAPGYLLRTTRTADATPSDRARPRSPPGGPQPRAGQAVPVGSRSPTWTALAPDHPTSSGRTIYMPAAAMVVGLAQRGPGHETPASHPRRSPPPCVGPTLNEGRGTSPGKLGLVIPALAPYAIALRGPGHEPRQARSSQGAVADSAALNEGRGTRPRQAVRVYMMTEPWWLAQRGPGHEAPASRLPVRRAVVAGRRSTRAGARGPGKLAGDSLSVPAAWPAAQRGPGHEAPASKLANVAEPLDKNAQRGPGHEAPASLP